MKVSGTKPHHLRSPARHGDVGYDLVNDEYRAIRPLQTVWLRTGVAIHVGPGYYARIVGRSSTARKSLLVLESIIDADYTGELLVGIASLASQIVIVQPGDRLAQLLVCRAHTPLLEYVDLPVTERGVQGFGSTGT